MIILLIRQMFLYPRPIPVRLPGKGFGIVQVLNDNHLAIEFTRRYRAGCGAGDQRAQQHRSLWINRLSISVAELIPDRVLFTGNLVAVISLGRQEIRIVQLYVVTRLKGIKLVNAPLPQNNNIVLDALHRQPQACRAAGADHKINTVQYFRRRRLQHQGDR